MIIDQIINDSIPNDQKRSILSDHKHLISLKNIHKVGNYLKDNPPQRKLNICLLRSYSIEPMLPFIETFLRIDMFQPQITLGGYNQFQQEIIDENSIIIIIVMILLFYPFALKIYRKI